MNVGLVSKENKYKWQNAFLHSSVFVQNSLFFKDTSNQNGAEFSFSNEAGGQWLFAGGDNVGTQRSS